MSVGKIIKQLRKENRLTQKELADKLGLTLTAVSAWERGANKPMMDKLSLMSELFNVPISTFYEEGKDEEEANNIIEVSQQITKIPILGEIACGSPLLVKENIIEYRTVLTESVPNGGNVFYLKAKGDSMHPTIPNGSMVLVRQQSDVENGEIAAVIFDDDNEATLKKVVKQNNTVMLVPENSQYQPIISTVNNPVRIIGKAIKVERDL